MNTTNDVTRASKTRPAKTDDGVCTGMLVTLYDSVALSQGNVLPVPAGSLITQATSSGMSWRLGCHSTHHKLGTSGAEIIYRR